MAALGWLLNLGFAGSPVAAAAGGPSPFYVQRNSKGGIGGLNMLISYKRGEGSIVLRVKVLNSSVTTGAGLTGLTSASSGLIISTIADNEATATAYTVAGSLVETIATLGTYAAPTATKCRFKEVDSTNHPGVYEIQLADARYAVTSAKSLMVTVSGATNAAQTDAVIPLWDLDPYALIAGQTYDEALRRIGAITSGIVTGAGTGQETLYDYAESANTIVITVDASGNRSAITYN